MNTPSSIQTGHRPQAATGRIPYLFRQKALISVHGHTIRPGGLMLTQTAVDICGFSDHDPVLDAGCGYGMTSRYLADCCRLSVTGTDLSSYILRQAGAKMTRPAARLSYACSALPELPFRSGLFKGIFCECVLSLISDKSRCLKEFLRVLQPNGRLVLTDLYIPQMFGYLRGRTSADPTAKTCLSGALPIVDLIRTIEESGFTIEIIEDHTALLKQLTSHIMMEGQADYFRDDRVLPGYCMIIAAKFTS